MVVNARVVVAAVAADYGAVHAIDMVPVPK